MWEMFYGIAALALVIALWYGTQAHRTRNRANDKITDAAVLAQRRDEENYDPEKFREKLKP